MCRAAAVAPNIVYILADDLGYGDLGCYNNGSKIPTPNLDRLATQGMRFTDAHAADSVCTPSRYAILTGRYCWRSETKMKWGVLGQWGKTLIEPGRLTVPGLLKEHGYTTACIGKWHLGWMWPTKDGAPPESRKNPLSNVDFTKPIADGPTTRGLDYYFGVDVPNYPPYCFIENDHTVGIPSVENRPEYALHPGPMMSGWQWAGIMPELTHQSVKLIEKSAQAQRPFFLYFALTAPHHPVVPAPEFLGKSRAGEYGDFVAQLDWTVGQVLDALRRSDVERDTLVIFTSDNGPETDIPESKPGAYGRIQQYGHYSMGELRGVKRDAWEGGHRVPFLARWPGTIKAGTNSSETISLVDLMATVAAQLDVKLPDNAGEDSYSLLPVLRGKKLDKPIREATVSHGSFFDKFVIRQGDWVLIDSPSGDGNGWTADGAEPAWFKKERGYTAHSFSGELFDLRQDGSERKNLYAEQPEKVRELKVLLEKYKSEGRSRP